MSDTPPSSSLLWTKHRNLIGESRTHWLLKKPWQRKEEARENEPWRNLPFSPHLKTKKHQELILWAVNHCHDLEWLVGRTGVELSSSSKWGWFHSYPNHYQFLNASVVRGLQSALCTSRAPASLSSITLTLVVLEIYIVYSCMFANDRPLRKHPRN